MKNIFTISYYTIREALSRKIFIFLLAIATLVLVISGLIFIFTSLNSLVNIDGGAIEIPEIVVTQVAQSLKVTILMPLYLGGIFLAIFSTSSFIPDMLEKGTVDSILSKPISRAQIIIGKFFGGTAIVFITIAYLVLGLWTLIGLKFSVWEPEFLITIISVTFSFAVIYAFIILIGVLTRSSIFSIILSYLIILALSPLLLNREAIYMLLDNQWIEYLLDGLYYIIPKTSELASITANLAAGGSIDSYQPIISSFLFMILSLGLSIFIFNKKDY